MVFREYGYLFMSVVKDALHTERLERVGENAAVYQTDAIFMVTSYDDYLTLMLRFPLDFTK